MINKVHWILNDCSGHGTGAGLGTAQGHGGGAGRGIADEGGAGAGGCNDNGLGFSHGVNILADSSIGWMDGHGHGG